MFIAGSGITTPLRVWIKPDFIPKTTLALKWAQLASNNWVATDRGAAADIYEAQIQVYGLQTTINELLVTLNNNRIASTGLPNQLNLSDFASNEKIFGLDIDYAPITIPYLTTTVTKFGDRLQRSLHGFSLSLTLQLISPQFVGTAGTITFEHIDIGYKADSTIELNKFDCYNGAFSYLDHRSDTGIIEATATIKNADHITFRRSLATQRGSAITTTIMNGINYPFGPNRSTTWPKNLTYIEVEELGNYGMGYQKVKFKAVENI